MSKILVIDDEVEICLILDKFLSKNGYAVTTAHTGEDGLEKSKAVDYDLIISDFRLPDYNGLDLLKKIKQSRSRAQVIIITGYSDIRMAVEVIKFGAIDYITKPLYPQELLNLIQETLAKEFSEGETQSEEELQNQDSKTETIQKVKRGRSVPYIIGSSKPSKSVYKNIEIVAPTPMSVVILGETGTGKEYVAREIHQLSDRKDKPFVAIDCGALPKDIAGSEFFGHEKGSFTGAIQSKDGKFKYADGGTLFLDEIGNLSYEIQIKLLRVLQEQKFCPIGSHRDITVDVRILVAANTDLKEAVYKGEFREDLYYRLNEFSIELSPLRDRISDLSEFTSSFIEKANHLLGKNIKGLSKPVIEKFENYSWPGNLRELFNVIKRSTLMAESEYIEISALPEEIIYHSTTPPSDTRRSLKGIANEAERERILKVLSQTGNNKSKTAKILNIDRKTLYNKLRNYDL